MEFATAAHEGQTYGDGRPYTAHLADVVGVLDAYGISGEPMVAAGWLHDTVEDTGVTIEDIKESFGDLVADMVYAVTDEPGKNRRERHEATYPKTAGNPGGVIIKLADRVANVQNCWDTQNSMLFMYQREYKGFRKALKGVKMPPHLEEPAKALWSHLDKLLGWWEPKKR